MAKTVVQSSSTSTVGSGVTTYRLIPNNRDGNNTTEALRQITAQFDGTLSVLSAIIANNGTDYASTIRTRINGSNGAMSISVPAATGGVFEDTSNSDAFVAGDEISYQIVNGTGTGTYIPIVIQCLIDADTNTVTMFALQTGSSSNSATHYYNLSATNISTTENNILSEINTAGTLKNLYVYISGNARITSTDFTARVANADTGVAVSVGAGATGVFEDTGTASVSANDRVGFKKVTTTGSGTITYLVGLTFETTNDQSIFSSGPTVAVPDATTYAFPLSGVLVGGASEGAIYKALNINADFSNLWATIGTNTTTSSSTFDLRKSGVSSSVTISIGDGATGTFEDTTHTESFSSSDGANVRMVNGGGGSIVLNAWSVKYEVIAAVGSSSVSPSVSPSSSISPSVSPSSSVSPSISPSISPSPSAGYEEYSRGDYAVLPTNNNDLETLYSAQDYLDVNEKDDVYVAQTGTGEYMIHEFKDFVGANSMCNVEWEGKTSLAPLLSEVVLEIYNHNTDVWDEIDSESVLALPDVDFSLSAGIADLTDYKDGSNVITCRVLQLAI